MADKTKGKKSVKKPGSSKNTKNQNVNIKNTKGGKGKSSGAVGRSGKTSGDEMRKRNMIIIAAVVLVVLAAAVAVYLTQKKEPEAAQDPGTAPSVVQTVYLETAKGAVTMEVYPDKMPVTVANFEKLVKSDFYNGLTFHRVEDFVVQGGDPQGDGKGGPGWTIPLEISPDLKNERGAVAMARSQEPDTAGSQFYILKQDAAWLDGQYAVFGRVIQGMDVVDQLQPGDKMDSVSWVQ